MLFYRNFIQFYSIQTLIEDIKSDLRDSIPVNTINKQKWAMKIFKEWHAEWKCRIDEKELKVYKEVEEFNKSDLNHCLKYFYCDCRKQNGERYPPATLKEIAALVQHYFNYEHNWKFSLFLDLDFEESTKILDSQMKKSAALGLVKPKKKAECRSYEIEFDYGSKIVLVILMLLSCKKH